MRVLAVSQVARPCAGRTSSAVGQRAAAGACELPNERHRGRNRYRASRQSPCRSSPVCAKRLARQIEPELQCRPTRPIELLEHRRIVGGRDDHEHVPEVLGGRAHQTGAADVDFLDQPVERRVGIRGGLHKWIQIDHDKIDERDAGARRPTRDPPAARGGPGCRRGRSGCSVFTRPSIISGKPVTSEMPIDGQPRLLQGARGAAGGHEVEPPCRKRTGKFDQPGLVGNAHKGARHAVPGS